MSAVSRQVIKKRAGVILPANSKKRRVFKPLYFFDSELKNLDVILDQNDTDLKGNFQILLIEKQILGETKLRYYSNYKSFLYEFNINNSDLLSDEEQEKLKDAYYLRYVQNQYSLSGRPEPYNITITVKLGKREVSDILEDILNCFRLPLSIGIDFWAVLTSLAR